MLNSLRFRCFPTNRNHSRSSNLRPFPGHLVRLRWLLAPVSAFLFLSPLASIGHAQGPPGGVPVVVAPVVEGEIVVKRTYVGTVTPSRTAIIGSAVDGRVSRFDINEGDFVAAGSTLAELLTETIKLELKAARAELEYRKQQLAELENGSRPEEIAQAAAKMAGSKARLEYLKAQKTRIESLVAASQVSREQLDESTSAAEAAEQAYLEAVAAHSLAVAGARKEQLLQSQAQVAMQEAVCEKLEDQIKKHTIVTRFDGYVVQELTELGQWLPKGSPVAEVAALNEVDILANVTEDDITGVLLNDVVSVEIPSLPAMSAEGISGTVKYIVPQADLRARTFPVKIRVQNPIVDNLPAIKGGMFARVTFDRRTKGVMLHKDAMVLSGGPTIVFVVDTTPAADGGPSKLTVRPVPITLGSSEGTWIQVTGPLKPNERVVVEGNERLRPGAEIRIVRELPPPDYKSTAAANAPLSSDAATVAAGGSK